MVGPGSQGQAVDEATDAEAADGTKAGKAPAGPLSGVHLITKPRLQGVAFWRALAVELGHRFMDHRVQDVAAQLAFWSLLAVFPFSIFLLTVIGYIPLEGLDRQILRFIYDVMPSDAARLVDHTVHEVLGRQRGTLLLGSLAGWVWSAAGGMGTTSHAINVAYGVEETRGFWHRRILSIGLTIGAVGAIIVATTGILVGPNLVKVAGEWLGLGKDYHQLWRLLRWPMVVVSMMFMLSCLYHYLPDRRRVFRMFTPGAIAGLTAWILTSVTFNAYVRHFHAYTKTYGTLGGAVILLMWLYLSAVIIIMGAELNASLEHLRDRPVPQPK